MSLGRKSTLRSGATVWCTVAVECDARRTLSSPSLANRAKCLRTVALREHFTSGQLGVQNNGAKLVSTTLALEGLARSEIVAVDDFTSTSQYRRCQEIFARWYPGFRNAGEQFRDIVADLVTPDTLLLDLGCGRTSLAAEPMQRASRSVGVDISLQDLQHNHALSDLILADGELLPFADSSFDLVVSQWAVEHFERPGLVFAQIARILRPGGNCVLFTTNAHNYIPLMSRLLSGKSQSGLIAGLLQRPAHESFPTYYRANTAAQIGSLCQRFGLRPTTTVYVGNPFYLAFSPLLFYCGLVFEKLTDDPHLKHLKLYLLTVLTRPANEQPSDRSVVPGIHS